MFLYYCNILFRAGDVAFNYTDAILYYTPAIACAPIVYYSYRRRHLANILGGVQKSNISKTGMRIEKKTVIDKPKTHWNVGGCTLVHFSFAISHRVFGCWEWQKHCYALSNNTRGAISPPCHSPKMPPTVL